MFTIILISIITALAFFLYIERDRTEDLENLITGFRAGRVSCADLWDEAEAIEEERENGK